MAGAGDRVSTHVVNVTDPGAVAAMPAVVEAVHGHVDAVINIAGIIHRFTSFEDLTAEETQRVLEVNLIGTIAVSRAFLPVLQQRPRAALVNMASLAALVPFAGQTLYGASKAAVKQFSEGIYAELRGSTVTVSTIFPGNIATNLTGNSGVAMIDAGGRKVRSTSPEDAGRQIVQGIANGRFRILIGRDARLLSLLERLAPRWTTDMVARQMASVLSPPAGSRTPQRVAS